MPQVKTSAGPIEYSDTGGDGTPVVLFGGLAIGPTLWDGVRDALREDHRVVVLTLPWGAHRLPMDADADLSLAGHARIVVEAVEAIGLGDAVVLVENDTGMTQLIAADAPAWVAGIVFTSCEAFENYPPGLPGKVVGLVGRARGGLWFAMQQLRPRLLRRSPLTFGLMSLRPVPHAVFDGWIAPMLGDPLIRRDLRKYLRTVDRRAFLDNAERLRAFDRPALVAWAAEDRVMPPEHGRRLAALLPQAQHVEIPGSRTLIPIDQPVVLAGLIRDFAAPLSARAARTASPRPTSRG